MKKLLVYVANPYTGKEQERYEAICEVVREIIMERPLIVPFSPIAFTHQFADIPDIDWVDFDLNFLDVMDAMLVVMLEGWDESYGVGKEIEHCGEHRIPIYYASPPRVIEVCEWMLSDYRRSSVEGIAARLDAGWTVEGILRDCRFAKREQVMGVIEAQRKEFEDACVVLENRAANLVSKFRRFDPERADSLLK